MSINLRPEIRSPLAEKLADILAKTEVANGYFLDHKYFDELNELEQRLQRKTETWRQAEDYISDRPFVDMFFEQLSEWFQKNRKYDLQKEKVLLNTFSEFTDTTSVAERLIQDFESLPWEYKCFVTLPLFNLKEALSEQQHKLSDALSLIFSDEQHQLSFPAPQFEPPARKIPLFSFNFGKADRESTLNWVDYFPYLEVSVSGFIGIYEETSPLKKVSLLIRSFCGLALALRLFEVRFPSWPSEAYMAIYEKNEVGWAAKKTRTLSSELVQGLDRLRMHTRFSEDMTSKKAVKAIFALLERIFQRERDHEQLLLAGRWYFDSFCGDSELLAFIKATICLEILLGDKKLTDVVGLGKLMSNRCAYLISTSQQERDEVLNDFDKIYATRSRIVHSGKDRLTNAERSDLFTLRWLCSRVLRKEIELRRETV